MSLVRETLPGGTVLYTGAAWPITSDALLLASFCKFQRRFSVCDLGAGSGILLFSLLDAGLLGRATAVELNAAAADALRQSAAAGGFTNVTVANEDLRRYKTARPYDMVVANPPYFSQGAQPKTAARAAARHQVTCTLGDVCAAAARLLKDGGRFCLCWPAGDLAPLLAELRRHHLAPKRLQLVRKTPQSEARLLLLDARKHGGEHLAILPDILLGPGQSLSY